MIDALLPYKSDIQTITSDNGTEFARHKEISKKLDADFYFAHPYSSWERGCNENTNGLVRQYILKKQRFENISEVEIKEIQMKINRRPRKKTRLPYAGPGFLRYLAGTCCIGGLNLRKHPKSKKPDHLVGLLFAILSCEKRPFSMEQISFSAGGATVPCARAAVCPACRCRAA